MRTCENERELERQADFMRDGELKIDLSADVRTVLREIRGELERCRERLNEDIVSNPEVSDGSRDTRYRCGTSRGLKIAMELLEKILMD